MARKLIWTALAVGFLMSSGCCAFWDRWCHRGGGNNYGPQQGAPYCCPTAPQCCPTNSYSGPGGAVPVPNVGSRSSWQGNCQ